MDGLSLDDEAGGGPDAAAHFADAGRRTPLSLIRPPGDGSAPSGKVIAAGLRVDVPATERREPPTWLVYTRLSVFYAFAALAASWPLVLSFTNTLPAPGDSAQHLWIMNWNKTCLLQGKLPFFCPQIQYPLGAPLGLFSPLQLQSALFLPISLATGNDILSYNLVWLIGLVTAGLGVFALCWRVTGHRPASAMGGLLAMLGAPVFLHAHAHLELHFIGPIALFVIAWLRLLERPGWGRLAAAVACYALMGASAAYFIVLTVLPASWIAAWRLVLIARDEGKAAAVARLKWLAGFGFAALPVVAVLMSNQLWALAHGSVMKRPFSEFATPFSTAPLWGYLVPSRYHTLMPFLMPFDPWVAAGNPSGYHVIERDSYLGVVTLFLMAAAMFHRAGGRRALLWWSLFAMAVIFGLGCYAQLGVTQVSLPTLWLWKVFPPFKLLRLPARFNLLAVIFAAIVASYGLGYLLDSLRRRTARAALLLGLSALAIVDLGLIPYRDTSLMPPMPAAYTWIKQHDPAATLFEWPVLGPLTAERTYWSKDHGLPTSEGYSGVNNLEFFHRIVQLSPLEGLLDPNFLATPAPRNYGPIRDASFDDYLWIYLKANGYRDVLIHEGLGSPCNPWALLRLKQQLAGSQVFQQDLTTVYEHARMPEPKKPVLACTEGWKSSVGFRFPWSYGVTKLGRMELFNPTPDAPLMFELEANACRSAREVRLMKGGDELARWTIQPDVSKPYVSPPFRLPAGVSDLTLESDAMDRPKGPDDSLDEALSPYSLKVAAIRLRDAGSELASAKP